MSNYHIRPAVESDIPAILELTRELATYEKQPPEAVKATPELMKRNLFEKRHASAFLAFEGSTAAPGKAIGLALYFFNYSTWTGKPGVYLEDLFVKPEFRNYGVGKALFGELWRVAEDNDCARIDWSVLTWNQPSIDFYEQKLGAKGLTEWLGMRLEGDGISRLSSFRLQQQ